jgi:hypothetical protein
MNRIVAVACAILLVGRCACARQNPFEFEKAGPPRVVVTIGTEPAAGTEGQPAMLLRLRGVLADIAAKDARNLRATVRGGARIPDLDGSEARFATLHLSVAGRSRRVDVVRAATGELVASEVFIPGEAFNAKPRRAVLEPERFWTIAGTWSEYRGTFEAPDARAASPGSVFELSKPHRHGAYRVDAATIGERLYAGDKSAASPTTRELGESTISARLPRGYSPRSPAGVVVWIDASPAGVLPPVFFGIADELNLILVGAAESGNGRPVPDRFQLAFDALATVAERYHVDPSRVYVSGISGGGKVATMMWMGFPEVFRGALPIVGLATYTDIPIGDGTAWPRLCERPAQRHFDVLKRSRCGAMTGRVDFNYEPMVGGLRLLERDGLQVKLFERPDMGHELPHPDLLASALRWVDAPAAEVAAKRSTDGRAAIAKLKGAGPATPAGWSEGQRKSLLDVVRMAPWSGPAWEAIDMLGAVPVKPSEPETP